MKLKLMFNVLGGTHIRNVVERIQELHPDNIIGQDVRVIHFS